MKLRDSIDVPDEVARGPHSPALKTFLWEWFGYGRELMDGALDRIFIKDLTPEELAIARDMVRRNLKLRQDHIIEAVADLNDVDAAPILRTMLAEEPDESRRLVIAGTLWKIARDPAFIEVLNRAKTKPGLSYMVVTRALWLDDYRAVDFLIDLLHEKDRECTLWRVQRRRSFHMPFRRFWSRLITIRPIEHPGNYALMFLNRLEFGQEVGPELKHLPSYYRMRRNELAFRDSMTAAVHRWNAEWNGRLAVAAE